LKVLVLGGGPGGLYAALLLRKAHPEWSVELVERNPSGATYGWGIVFSDRTLASFREADATSYREIVDRFVLWDVIEVRHRGEAIRCGGNVFAGMSREVLLDVLQRRARELGVVLTFRTELGDPSRLDAYDLCIGADGANSFVRRSFASSFRPRVQLGRSKYAWFGTDQLFDAFTFIFRATEHGLFQAHVYPHIGAVATMVIECAESTWHAAGLDQAGEAESVAFCERVFREDLGGHRILANKSDWLSFPTIRNRAWRHGRLVLLGDAAHTAHFSVGSGTKLAMEDAIALASAFERHAVDVDRALDEYELERRPVVEALQQAALESQEVFENSARYAHFSAPSLAFHLLTRSSRISYDELRRRDSSFIDRIDRGFFDAHDGRARPRGTRRVAPPPAFAPLRLRGLELANRVVLSPAAAEGRSGLRGEAASAALVRSALGGAGLVLTEISAVSPEGRITPDCSGIYRAETAAGLRRLAELVHEQTDAKLGVQIGHAGRRGSMRPRREGLDRPLEGGAAWPLLSASAIAYAPGHPLPSEMTRAEMDRVRDDFVRAARTADRAGADLLQLHAAQGYLLWSFLSPVSNRRTDSWGGSLERRAAFPLEVVVAVREVWPDTKPLSVALSASDWLDGGLGPDDVVAIARMLHDRGCDLAHVITGIVQFEGCPRYDAYATTLHSDRVRNESGIATLVAVRSATTDEINGILAAGRGDLCLLPPQPSEAGGFDPHTIVVEGGA